MENKLKTIIVYYVNIGNLDDKDVKDYVKDYKKEISLKKDIPGIVELYIPSRGKEGVEMLYVE